PAGLVGIGGEVALHVFVDFFLQVNADGAKGANYLVGANAGSGGHVAVRVGNSNVRPVVADDMVSTLDRSGDKALRKLLISRKGSRRRLGAQKVRRRGQKGQDAHPSSEESQHTEPMHAANSMLDTKPPVQVPGAFRSLCG